MQYLTIKGEASARYEISRSIFICSIKGIENFDEGMEYVKTISKKFSDATHNCYAIVTINNEQKFSDNGEPQGTAGMPILQVLKKRNLSNVACVITRYFGGIKLGAGGLVASYTKATCDGIDNAIIITKKESAILSITVEYSDYSTINNVLENGNYPVLDRRYDNAIEIDFAVPIDEENALRETLREKSNGRITPKKIEVKYIDYK